MARSKDYVVIMHFGECLKGKIFGQNMDEHLVDEAFTEHTMNLRRQGLRNMNFPSDVARLEHGRTYQKQSNGTAKALVEINREGAEYQNLPPQAKEHLQKSLKKNIVTANTQSVVPKRKTGFQ